MNIFSTLMVLLGLMATALSSPTCGPKCNLTKVYHHPDLKHVSELGSNSVAPWEYLPDTKAGREPAVIQYAHCKGCTVQNMIAKPIFIQVSVYERVCKRPPAQPFNMQNDAGEFVDLYVPRKCSASNRIIGAKDHASIQINIAEVDKVTGRFNGQFKTYAICGAIRRMGESDDSILRLAKNDSVVAKNF
ncbi:hypothetical protein ABVT39_022755 [Epinephelus coioides]